LESSRDVLVRRVCCLPVWVVNWVNHLPRLVAQRQEVVWDFERESGASKFVEVRVFNHASAGIVWNTDLVQQWTFSACKAGRE
jgi:hypothetical protein